MECAAYIRLIAANEALRIASLLLWAVMPEKIEQLWGALNLSIDPANGKLNELTKWGGLQAGSSIEKVAMFPRKDEALA